MTIMVGAIEGGHLTAPLVDWCVQHHRVDRSAGWKKKTPPSVCRVRIRKSTEGP
jgi:hypothetical protein